MAKFKDFAGKTLLITLLIFAGSNLVVFGQENSQKKIEGSFIGGWLMKQITKTVQVTLLILR